MRYHQILEAKLPMDDASRLARAEEMGFDTSKVWYHGTMRKTFKNFRVGKGGIDELGPGVYFCGSETRAGTWGRPALGGRILACFIKRGKLYDYSKLRPCKQTADRTRNAEIERIHAYHTKYMNDHFAMPGVKSGYDLEDFIEFMRGRGVGDFNRFLAHAGYIGAVDHYSQIPDQVVVFDPTNIRSIKAKFDPAFAESDNINS